LGPVGLSLPCLCGSCRGPPLYTRMRSGAALHPGMHPQILRLHFTTPAEDQLDTESFWKFVARYLRVFVFPRFWGGHRDIPEERRGVLRVHHLRHLGFGVSSVFALKHGDSIEGLWGRLFELTPEDSTSLESLYTSTRKTKVSGDNSSVEFILLGSLGLANHFCSAHSTIAPDQDELRRPLDPRTGLSTTDYTCAYTDVDTMPRFTPLVYCYGPAYVEEERKSSANIVLLRALAHPLMFTESRLEHCILPAGRRCCPAAWRRTGFSSRYFCHWPQGHRLTQPTHWRWGTFVGRSP
jgi:hypothetical protein